MAFHGTQARGSHLPANRRDGLMLLYNPGRAFTDGPESGHRAQSFSLLIKPIRGGTFGVHHGMRRHTLMGRGKNFRLSEDNRVRISFPHEKGKHGTRG